MLARYLKKMGIHVLDPDYQVFNRHLLVFFAISTLYTIMVLTAIKMADGDFVNTVKSLTTFGIFIQVSSQKSWAEYSQRLPFLCFCRPSQRV